MSKPAVTFVATPLGSNVFKDIFDKEQARLFAEKIIAPMPMIVSSGPEDKTRHWDWKERSDFVIVEPVEPYNMRRLEDGSIIFDEYAKMSKVSWEKISRDSDGHCTFAIDASTGALTEPLTGRHIKEAMEKISMAGKKIAKRKKLRGDPRRAKYSARQFGNILLSATKDIINNTTLADALYGTGLDVVVGNTLDLIKPLFEEFFLSQGDKWEVTGPMSLSAQNIESGQWKSVSAIGGEILHYKSVEIGSRDGVCILWETGAIIGMEEEMIINTTIKKFGDKIVPAQLQGNPANRETLVDLLLGQYGKEDIITAAEEAKAKIEIAITAKKLEERERKAEAYGSTFGSWG